MAVVQQAEGMALLQVRFKAQRVIVFLKVTPKGILPVSTSAALYSGNPGECHIQYLLTSQFYTIHTISTNQL